MNDYFVPINEKENDKYMIKFDKDGICACQTKENLCLIQWELGAEYLSITCTIFPRYNAFDDNDSGSVYRGCTLSCPDVVKLLINNERAAELINITAKENMTGQLIVCLDSAVDILVHPELNYSCEMFEFFYELVGNKKNSIETLIILGALAVQKLAQLIENDQYVMIPDALKAFRKQIHNASVLKSIAKVKPNYNVKFGVAEKISENALDFRMTDVLKDENGELDIDRYLSGEAKLTEMMKNKPV